MAESGNISNVFLKFSRKLEKFKNADENNRKINKTQTKDRVLQELIHESEEEKINSIINTYSSFKMPFSKSVEEDENSLVTSYNLFKSVTELNKATGSDDTFIKNIEFESPLVHKDFYATGDKFIFLQCWFCLEKNITDFVPSLTADSSGKIHLDFISQEDFTFSPAERYIFEVIKKSVYNSEN